MIKINNVLIKVPKACQVDIEDIDGESFRNAKGEIVRDRIATKRKLNCEWGPLSTSEISNILKAVSSEFFTVSYPDPLEGKIVNKIMYVGNRNAPVYSYINEKPKWQGLKMNFIEK